MGEKGKRDMAALCRGAATHHANPETHSPAGRRRSQGIKAVM